MVVPTAAPPAAEEEGAKTKKGTHNSFKRNTRVCTDKYADFFMTYQSRL